MTNTRTKQKERTLYIILAAALAARLLLALVTEGYTYDMSCFVAWGDKLASEGPAAFYSADYFADYPPGYILVLGLVSLVRKALQLSYESRWTYFLLALIPAICDCAAVVLLDHISRRYMGQGRAQRCLVLFAAFCPLTLFDTGIWKQIDGAFALPLLLCFWLLEERRYLLAAVLYGVALAIKPQALLFGPVLAVCFLAAIVQEENRFRAFLRCFGGAALALFPPLALGLPYFGLTNLLPKLLEKYAGALPTWLMPTQAMIIPISEKHHDYAQKVLEKLQAAGIRVEADWRSEKMGYKIREAQLKKIPYMLVVGEKEAETDSVSVRTRKGTDGGAMSVDEFVQMICEEIREKRR